jgi:hypothetical protein
MQIILVYTNGSCSVADRKPDMMEMKDPVSTKIISTKGITENHMRCGHLNNTQFPSEVCTFTIYTLCHKLTYRGISLMELP